MRETLRETVNLMPAMSHSLSFIPVRVGSDHCSAWSLLNDGLCSADPCPTLTTAAGLAREIAPPIAVSRVPEDASSTITHFVVLLQRNGGET